MAGKCQHTTQVFHPAVHSTAVFKHPSFSSSFELPPAAAERPHVERLTPNSRIYQFFRAMADELHTGSSSAESWWGTSRTGFNEQSSSATTAFSEVRSFGWAETAEMKSRSCEESASVSSNSIHFQDTPKAQAPDSISGSCVLMDSAAQMARFVHPLPSAVDWSQALLHSSERGETSFHAMLQEDLSSRVNYRCPPMILQSFTEPNAQPELSPYDGQSVNYPSSLNYQVNSNELSSPWSKFPQFLKNSHPKQQQPNQLHFSNNTPFWNASATEPMNDIKPSFYPSSQNQFLTPVINEKPNCSNFAAKISEEFRESGSTLKKSSTEPLYKRSRNETPTQLPAFKVRKEKLGDRITTLQQLVSPFGKTDTASVLLEAIECIKFLHGQVSVLSAPYLKNVVNTQQQQNSDKSKEAEGSKQDLRSHGLCLVPVSIIIPVASETATDFWTPTYGGTFR